MTPPTPHQPAATVRNRLHENDLLVAAFGTDYLATTRHVRVVFADSHSDALTFVGVDGRPVDGELVSFRAMTDAEIAAFEAEERGTADDCDGFAAEQRGAA